MRHSENINRPLEKEEVIKAMLKALNHRLYNRYSKDLWLMPVVCPDFLDRCRIYLTPDGVRVEMDYPNARPVAQVIDPDKPEQESIMLTYLETLIASDPDLSTIPKTRLPKAVWDMLYSLASVVFNMKVGAGRMNLIAPYTTIHDDRIELEVRKVSEDEARELIKSWVYEFTPYEHAEELIKELVSERLIGEDFSPMVRLKLLYEVIMVKGSKAELQKFRSKAGDSIRKLIGMKKCPYCGAEFIPKNPVAVFCSNVCASTFHTYMKRNKLMEEYEELKAQGLGTGLLPEEATEKAVLQMIEKYPFLSKAKRQELGLGRQRKPKKESG